MSSQNHVSPLQTFLGSADLDVEAAASLLHVLFDAFDRPAFVKDVSGTYLIANDAFLGLLDFSDLSALIGRRDKDLLPHRVAAQIHASDQNVIDTAAVLSVEHEIGGRRLLFRKVPWRNAAGRVIAIAGTVRDLMGSRHRASRLQENEEVLELAEEAGVLGIFEWQVAAGTMRVSPKFLSLYGLVEFDGQYET